MGLNFWDFLLFLILIFLIFLGILAYLLKRLQKLKFEKEKEEKLRRLFQEVFNKLPVEALIIKNKEPLFLNRKALENLGPNPEISKIKEHFKKKGKKIEFFEIELDKEEKLFLIFDVTEKEALKETYQMALSYLSHEFKTPFTIALGYTERLESLLEKGATLEEIKEPFLKVKESLKNLERLLKKLFSGLDYLAKEVKLRKEVFSLKEIIEEAFFWAGPLAEDKGVELELKMEEELKVSGSAELLTQAFFNVIENAVKVSPKQGKVTVCCYPYNHKKVLISVKDKGPGVPEEKLSLLGMPFFKLRNTDGTGLGLFITRRIIEAHGGEIRFFLPKDGGLEVRILLERV